MNEPAVMMDCVATTSTNEISIFYDLFLNLGN